MSRAGVQGRCLPSELGSMAGVKAAHFTNSGVIPFIPFIPVAKLWTVVAFRNIHGLSEAEVSFIFVNLCGKSLPSSSSLSSLLNKPPGEFQCPKKLP